MLTRTGQACWRTCYRTRCGPRLHLLHADHALSIFCFAASILQFTGAVHPRRRPTQAVDNIAQFAEHIIELAWPTAPAPPPLPPAEQRSLAELFAACDLGGGARLAGAGRVGAAERRRRVSRLWEWLLALPDLRKVKRPGQVCLPLRLLILLLLGRLLPSSRSSSPFASSS